MISRKTVVFCVAAFTVSAAYTWACSKSWIQRRRFKRLARAHSDVNDRATFDRLVKTYDILYEDDDTLLTEMYDTFSDEQASAEGKIFAEVLSCL